MLDKELVENSTKGTKMSAKNDHFIVAIGASAGGLEAIHEFFTKLQVTGLGPEGRRFRLGEQREALTCGDLALTSTRSLDGDITSEVARRQDDGTWLWVIDRWSVNW